MNNSRVVTLRSKKGGKDESRDQKDGGEGWSLRVGVVEWVRKQQGCGSGAAPTEAADGEDLK